MLNNINFNLNLDKSALYLSALSGGADSTALLLWLKDEGYNVEAVHCNFHLRGAESDRDENFCKQLCQDNGIKLHIVHFDTTSYATLHKLSIETAARNLRYGYFFALAKDVNAKGVFVAHNKNDQVETMLMNLVRGAGIKGLTGMQQVYRPSGATVPIIRPFLGVTRQQIEAFLNGKRQGWVNDSTNFETDATRNKFRLEVIPLLKKINPSAIDNIADACSRLGDVAKVYDESIKESIQKVTENNHSGLHIDITKLKLEVSPESVLYEILSGFGFNSKQVADIFSRMNNGTGKIWTSTSHQLVIDRNDIIVEKKEKEQYKEFKIPETGVYRFGEVGKFRVQQHVLEDDFKIPHDSSKICLDSRNVSFPLVLRNYRSGDRFVPFGMKGSKLVSDFLTDNKLSVLEKKRQMVLCNADGDIIWVVGIRPDNRFRVSNETKEILEVSIEAV